MRDDWIVKTNIIRSNIYRWISSRVSKINNLLKNWCSIFRKYIFIASDRITSHVSQEFSYHLTFRTQTSIQLEECSLNIHHTCEYEQKSNFDFKSSTFSWIRRIFELKKHIFSHPPTPEFDHSRKVFINIYFVIRHIIDTDSSEWFFSLSICLYGNRLYQFVSPFKISVFVGSKASLWNFCIFSILTIGNVLYCFFNNINFSMNLTFVGVWFIDSKNGMLTFTILKKFWVTF